MNFFDATDHTLLRILQRGDFNIHGWRSADLTKQLQLTPWAISRQLERRRLLGLIKRVSHTYRYYLTRLGRAALAAGLLAHAIQHRSRDGCCTLTSSQLLSRLNRLGTNPGCMMFRVRRSNPFRITTPRQQLMILAAAIGTAAAVSLVLLLAHVRIQRTKPAHTSPTPCTPGRDGNCIGGTMEVMLLAPAPSPASASASR